MSKTKFKPNYKGKANRVKSQKNMENKITDYFFRKLLTPILGLIGGMFGIPITFMVIYYIVFNLIFPDVQVLKFDYPNNQIEIINSNEYIIDSVSIASSSHIYYSKSLKNKSEGSKIVTLDTSNDNYKIYTDSLSVLTKDSLSVYTSVFIREKEGFLYFKPKTKLINHVQYVTFYNVKTIAKVDRGNHVFSISTFLPKDHAKIPTY